MLAGFGEHSGSDTATGAGSNDDHVIVERAGERLRRLPVAPGRASRTFRQTVLVADHPPRCRAVITAIAGVGEHAFRDQFAQLTEPRRAVERGKRGVLVDIGEIDEARRQVDQAGRDGGSQLGLYRKDPVEVIQRPQGNGPAIPVGRHDAVDHRCQQRAIHIPSFARRFSR